MVENQDEEEYEIEVIEISLNEDEIEGLIGSLQKLKKSKNEFTFDLDDENELLIKYYDEDDLDDEELEDDGDEDLGEGMIK